jgi:cellulose synthase/poly-beta-1,6-N-acetylglucosamine synthase-like glycosyltransferase
MRYNSRKPWNLTLDSHYQPCVSILIPTHNEAKNIQKKLANLQSVDYPKEKIETIIIDDASDDETLLKIDEAIRNGLNYKLKVISQTLRGGKSVVLNQALSLASSPIIIVSDADTTWPSNVLKKAMPYLADPTIGAITGQGLNKQAGASWITKSEDNYLQITSSIRLGESKIHSTIRFEGGFCAYKRAAFNRFDCESGSDDSGTALEVNQHGLRTVLVPEVFFFTSFPTNLKGKLQIKVRRANQLVGLWIKCLKLMLQNKLVLPKRILLPETFLFIINPSIFIISIITMVLSIFLVPFSISSLTFLAIIFFLLIFARMLFLELIIDNLLLFYASISYLFGRRYVAWKKNN